MKKPDPEQVLAKAKEYGQEWLDAFRTDGKHDIDACVKALSGRTGPDGKPVLTLVVGSPSEAVPALAFGGAVISLLGGKLNDGDQLRGQLGDQLGDQLGGQLWGQLWDQLGDQLLGQLGDRLLGQLRGQLGDQLRGQLGDQLRDQLGGQLWDQLGDQLWGQLGDQLGGQLWDQLGGQLWDQLGGQLWDQLGDQLGGQLRDQLLGQLKESYRCVWDYYCQAWYEAAMCAAGLSHWFIDQSLMPAFKSGVGYIINMGSLIVGVLLPEAYRDDRMLLHRENGPALVWGSEEPQYWWHGTKVPAEWIRDKALTPQRALAEENAELRRAACEILGWKNILSLLDARVIDKDPDEFVGTLLEVDLPGAKGSRFLSVRCGTGREFVLPVPSEMTTALQANAWGYDIDVTEFTKAETRT